jgi:uncharacterized membrane protein YkoI
MNALRLCLLALMFALAPLAQARDVPSFLQDGAAVGERGANGEIQKEGMSLDQAVRMAESQFHARVVRTDVVDEDGRKVYVLKLLSEGGRVITVRVDAASGRMR